MQHFRNMVYRAVVNDESFGSLSKRVEEYRKLIHTFSANLLAIYKVYEDYTNINSKYNQDIVNELRANDEAVPQFYVYFATLFKDLNNELHIFEQIQATSQRYGVYQSKNFFQDFNTKMQQFHSQLKYYSYSYYCLKVLGKKYFRSHKLMLGKIDQYKQSFTYVKLIYNQNEKTKRYIYCTSTFKLLCEYLQAVADKVVFLNYAKNHLAEKYKLILQLLASVLKKIGNNFISSMKSLCLHFNEMQNKIIGIFNEKQTTLYNNYLQPFFYNIHTTINEYSFNCDIDNKKCVLLPPILVYYEGLKNDHLKCYNKRIIYYLQAATDKHEKRKHLHRKMVDYIRKYFRVRQRNLIDGFKEIMTSIYKLKKRLGYVFGTKWIGYLTCISSIFANYLQFNSKLMYRFDTRMSNIYNSIASYTTCLDNFLKYLRVNLYKTISKKYLKRLLSYKQIKELEFIEEAPTKEEIAERSTLYVNLITVFNTKVNKSTYGIKTTYTHLLNDLRMATCELANWNEEYCKHYFLNEKRSKYCEEELAENVDNDILLFREPPFETLAQYNAYIEFLDYFYKVYVFRQIKYPSYLSYRYKYIPYKDKYLPYWNFLNKKCHLNNDEQVVDCFTCGLTDKIILTGKLFITTHRICFHSNFNPSNIFFGYTFLYVPKDDIKNIYKQSNAIFFDTAIMITTTHGLMHFVSFLSRNYAYTVLCDTFHIVSINANMDEGSRGQARDYESNQEKDAQGVYFTNPQINYQLDYLDEDMEKERMERLEKLLTKFPYETLNERTFIFPYLTALQFFRTVYANEPAIVDGKLYSNFIYFFKYQQKHKYSIVGKWYPNPFNHMNSNYLKNTIPDVFRRKISAIIPIPKSGIPFMPKATKTNYSHLLYWMTRKKYVIETIIANNGVPFCDTYTIRVKKTVYYTETNQCVMTIQMFIDFTQNPLVKGIIQSKTIEESRISYAMFSELVNSHFKSLKAHCESKILKPSSKISSERQTSIVETTIAEPNLIESNDLQPANGKITNELIQLRQYNSQLQQSLVNLYQKQAMLWKIIYFMAIFNILMLLYWTI